MSELFQRRDGGEKKVVSSGGYQVEVGMETLASRSMTAGILNQYFICFAAVSIHWSGCYRALTSPFRATSSSLNACA